MKRVPPPRGAGPTFRNKVREEVLRIGKGIIRTEGLTSIQARRLAAEAGCAVGSLYNVFGDLDDLIIALNRQTLADLEAALLEAHEAHRGESMDARLLAMAEAYFEFANANMRPWRAIFEHTLPEGASAPPEYREDQNRLFALVEDCLGATLSDPAERGSAARALFASVHGIVSLALDRKLGEYDPVETRTQIRFLVGCATRGLTT